MDVRDRLGAAMLVAVALAALGVVGAALGAASSAGLLAVSSGVPVALAAVGVGVAVLLVGALAHAARRRDLARVERLALVGILLVLPPAALAYVALGREQTATLARRLVALATAPSADRAAPR